MPTSLARQKRLLAVETKAEISQLRNSLERFELHMGETYASEASASQERETGEAKRV
jgi:hypothetical protein